MKTVDFCKYCLAFCGRIEAQNLCLMDMKIHSCYFFIKISFFEIN
jgi:hypothetical protein